jgi:hypothetical protein
MIRLSHPCVVAIVGCSLPTKKSPAQIATRYAANGSLRQALDMSAPFLDNTGRAVVVCGIIVGMKFIHSQGFMHRDLKPENILLDERGFAQIGDLGSSRFYDTGLTLTTRVGTPLYMAPEMYDDACDYTWAVDVYSFALIVYEVLAGQPAFPLTLAPSALMKKVVPGDRPRLPADMDAMVKTIVERGWSVEPTMRLSFDDIFTMLESIEFRLSAGVDSVRVHEFMSLVGCGSGASGADGFWERRPGNAGEGVAADSGPNQTGRLTNEPEGRLVDAASVELSEFLLTDRELPVDRREFPCIFERRKKMQKAGWGFWSKEVDVEVDEVISPLDGIVAHLTRECGGNVADHGLVRVVGSSVHRDDAEFVAKNAADLASDSVFYSRPEPDQWLCYDFSDMVVIPTHYSIRAGSDMAPRNWVIEGRKCEAEWLELDRREKDESLKGINVEGTFPVS